MFTDLSHFTLVNIDSTVGAGVAGRTRTDEATVYGGRVAHGALVARVTGTRVLQMTQ